MRAGGKNVLEFGLVLGGKFSNLAILFLGGLLVARLAGATEYGVFAVALSLVMLGDGLLGAPLDLAVVRFFALHPGEDERTRRFEALGLQLKGVCLVFAFGAILALRNFAGRWWPELSAPGFPLLACFLALAGLLAARSTAAALQNRRRFRAYSVLDLSQAIARAVGFLGLAWLQMAGSAPFLLVHGLVPLAVAVVGWTVLQQGYLLGARPDREDTRRMLVYCGFTAGVVALGSLTGRGDLLLLAARKGAGASAAYALAAQLAMLLAQVAMYASVLTQPRVLGLHRQSSLRRLFAVNLLVVACCTGIGAALWNPAILSGLLAGTFGSAFEASVPLLGILLLGVVFDWLIVPVLMVFGIQTCPGKVFVGELLVAIGFFALGTAAVVRPWPWPAEFIMAWIAVGGRAAKLVFYGVLFFTGTRSSQKAPLPGEP